MQLISPSPSVTSPYSGAQTLCDPMSPLAGPIQNGLGFGGHNAMGFNSMSACTSPARAQVNPASSFPTTSAFTSTNSLNLDVTSLAIPTLMVPSHHNSPVSPRTNAAHPGSSPTPSLVGSMVSVSPIQQLSPAAHPTVLSAVGTPTNPSIASFASQLLAASAASTSTTPISPQAQHNDPLAFLDLVSSTNCSNGLQANSMGTLSNQDLLSAPTATGGAQLGRRASVCSTNPSAFSPLSHALGRPKSVSPASPPPATPLVTITSVLDSHPYANAAALAQSPQNRQ
ncbi:hypothetical protein BCR44DRAFT_1444531, partial [Catenaria anguillulae PL171]